MALADTPETVNARRRAEQGGPPEQEARPRPFIDPEDLSEGFRTGNVTNGAARDDSHPAMRLLRTTLKTWNSAGYVKVLGILEIVCPTDRAYERARKQVLDLMNSQERTMVEIINRLAGPPQAKVKE